MNRVFTAERFFDGDVLHGPTCVEISNGVVTSIEPFTGEADNFLIAPGYVDVQVNGFEEIDVAQADDSELSRLDIWLRQLGTTHWLGTVITAPLERMNSSIKALNAFCTSTNETGCEGIHLEGPFLGDAPGAHNQAWIVPFDNAFIDTLPSTVKLMTIAPEQDESRRFIEYLTSRDIVVSIGHSKASAEQTREAINAGVTMATHVFNGMSGIHHRDGGVALEALLSSSIATGLIADLVHVSPEIINLVFRMKGARGVVLVSDTIAWSHDRVRQRGIEVRFGAPRLADQTLAGSCTPLAECVRNCVSAGISLEVALAAATSVPADLMGFSDAGRIAVGRPVDMNILDADLLVTDTLFRLQSIRG